MRPAPEPRRRRRLTRWLVAVVVLAIGAVGTVELLTGHGQDSAPRAPSSRSHARAVGGAPPPSKESPVAGRRAAAVRALLAARERAVRGHDRRAFLATVDHHDRESLAGQARLFGNLARLPLSKFDYDLVPDSEGVADPKLLERYGTAHIWTPRVTLRYRLSGFDTRSLTVVRYLTLILRPGGWRVAGLASGSDSTIFDLGSIHAARGRRSLVIGQAPRAELRSIADRVDRAVPVVSEVWGTDWNRTAVVLVPDSQADATELSPHHRTLSQIAAVATVISGPHGVPPAGTGDRVIVNPKNFARLSPLGRRVVLTHELTHIATRQATTATVPMWLVEGFADYVGYHGLGLPATRAASELTRKVRAGHLPSALPTAEDFDGDSGNLSLAYEEGWLACRFIADRHGQDALVDLYRRMGSVRGHAEPEARRRIFRSVLGTDIGTFTRAWRSYLEARLSGRADRALDRGAGQLSEHGEAAEGVAVGLRRPTTTRSGEAQG
ncbi:MAG: peptidase MA family metallohydrolase, partial [Streptosporangiaceae bacterium]